MKKYLLALVTVALVMSSCTEQFPDETTSEKSSVIAKKEFDVLMEQARWGNGSAFLQLADCYRDGYGVKQDFVGMLSMLALADEFESIDCIEDYLNDIQEGSDFRLIIDAMDKNDEKQVEKMMMISEELINRGCLDGYTVQGMIAVENGDTIEGEAMLRWAASQGSNLSELMLFFLERRRNQTPDLDRLISLSDRIPIVNIFLAGLYLGVDDESLKNEELAAFYYMKAEKYACLGKQGARWLLDYHRNGGNISLSGGDLLRLQFVACETKSDD